MIEIQRRKIGGGAAEYHLIIDGEVLYNDEFLSILPIKGFMVEIKDEHTTNKILAHKFTDILTPRLLLHLLFSRPLAVTGDVLTRVTIRSTNTGKFYLYFILEFNYGEWRNLWSPKDYVYEFTSAFNKNNQDAMSISLLNRDDPSKGLVINSSIENPHSLISVEVSRRLGISRDFHQSVVSSLLSKLRRESVVTYFNFPEEVRVPCEQYLLYFAQFLRDLGVNADTALTHEAGQVLFTVTPEDKEQALDKIRATLEVYLHLPSSPVSDTGGNEIAVLRLNSELQSLQSKLSLARAEIQMKDAAIQLQKVTIAQLTGEVVFESLKDVTPKPKDKDKEELLGDIVSLVPIKGKGFEVNLPELLRKLKQLFKKEE